MCYDSFRFWEVLVLGSFGFGKFRFWEVFTATVPSSWSCCINQPTMVEAVQEVEKEGKEVGMEAVQEVEKEGKELEKEERVYTRE